jgi:hypothetical protein
MIRIPGILRDSLGNPARKPATGTGGPAAVGKTPVCCAKIRDCLRLGSDDDWPSRGHGQAMPGIRNGLYTVETDMTDGGRGHATGVIVLVDGKIAGGDAHFYYTGSYTAADGRWRGELTTLQHAKPTGVLPLFGGREVTCGFTGTYSDDSAVVSGTALVGKTSVLFETRLKFREAL